MLLSWFSKIFKQKAYSKPKVSNSQKIHQALKFELEGNESFINLVEQNLDFLDEFSEIQKKEVMNVAIEAAICGQRSQAIAGLIQKLKPDMEKKELQLISQTCISKVQAAITQVRAERLGLDWCIWQTCQDQRTRASHHAMQGVAFQYSRKPEPEKIIGLLSIGCYGPGEALGCRCYAAPIVDADFEKYPLRVLINGKIETMGKRKFKKLVGNL